MLYERPLTAFAAKFLGATNILALHVTAPGEIRLADEKAIRSLGDLSPVQQLPRGEDPTHKLTWQKVIN